MIIDLQQEGDYVFENEKQSFLELTVARRAFEITEQQAQVMKKDNVASHNSY